MGQRNPVSLPPTNSSTACDLRPMKTLMATGHAACHHTTGGGRLRIIVVMASVVCVRTNMSLRLLILTVAIAGALGDPIPDVEDCGSKSGSFDEVEVIPCDTKPCTLYKGSHANLTIKFKADHVVKSGKASVHGVIAGVPIPFPIPDNDLCTFASPSCPLEAGKTYSYMYSLEVKKTYPSISLHIRWELKEVDGDFHICVQFPAKLASSTAAFYKPRPIILGQTKPYLLDELRETWKRWFADLY